MRRRRQLFDSALELFSTRGFEAVGIRQIAEHAGVSKSLIGLHFSSKEGLREAVDRDVMARFEELLGAIFEAPEKPGDRRTAALERAERLAARRAEALPLLRYLRHAMLENSPAGHAMFRQYLDYVGGAWNTPRTQETTWLMLIVMFLQLGPILLEAPIEAATGTNPFTKRSMAARSVVYSLVEEKLQDVLKTLLADRGENA